MSDNYPPGDLVTRECPLCATHPVYFCAENQTYSCPQCGLVQSSRINPDFLQETARLTRERYEEDGNVNFCPICGKFQISRSLDGHFSCPRCGFCSSGGGEIKPEYLASLGPFKEVPQSDPPECSSLPTGGESLPVDELVVSFDRGKTRWVFAVSHKYRRGGGRR